MDKENQIDLQQKITQIYHDKQYSQSSLTIIFFHYFLTKSYKCKITIIKILIY
jgi:hypothetical protein